MDGLLRVHHRHKNTPVKQAMYVRSQGWDDCLDCPEWQPTPGFLPGEFHGQRSLAGCSPLGCKESDMTEVTENAHIHRYYQHVHS